MICLHCNGYYGPTYGQPICATCHMFLYPDSPFHALFWYDFKGDDRDSGNEEPREPNECNSQNEASGGAASRPPLESGIQEKCSDQKQMLKFTPSEASGRDELSTLSISQGLANFHSDKHSQLYKRLPEGPTPYQVLPASFYEESFNEETASEHKKNKNDEESVRSDNGTTKQITSSVNISLVPPEVLVVIFSFLDEVSLWAVSHVCRSWSDLVQQYTSNEEWKIYTHRRWPLFSPIYDVSNWNKVFTNLIESAPCQFCFLRMPYENISEDKENSWRKNRLSIELKALRSDPPEGISASPLDALCLRWQASIRGPAGSPYQGGTFFLYIQIPPSYPLSPPLVRFTTRIFHPNVARHGDIGIDSIQHNWSLALTISKVLISIQSLLTDPFTKICMEPKIGEIYDNNRSQFDRIAKAWTWRYAMHDAIDPETVTSDYIQRITSDYFQLQKQEDVDVAENVAHLREPPISLSEIFKT